VFNGEDIGILLSINSNMLLSQTLCEYASVVKSGS